MTFNAGIEAAARELEQSYPDNANTNAFCAAIRSIARPSSSAPVELREAVALGDIVYMNETSPYFDEWRGTEMKVVGLHLAPDGGLWADVIEGEQRHRGNGIYDGETTDIDVSHLGIVRKAAAILSLPGSSRDEAYAQGVADADQLIGCLWVDLFNKDLVKASGADYFDKWRDRIRALKSGGAK